MNILQALKPASSPQIACIFTPLNIFTSLKNQIGNFSSGCTRYCVGGGGGGCVCVCVGGVRMFMLSNEDTYMNFNLNTVDVPSNEDGPRSSDIGNDFNIT